MMQQNRQDRLFQYLGSRGAQRQGGKMPVFKQGFQYLGSRGAQRNNHFHIPLDNQFQYLGSRGAQPS